jgi:small subunit ribosomal protein S8
MSVQDYVSDYIARINNNKMADKNVVSVLKNNLISAVTIKLTKLGFFDSFEVSERTIEIKISPKMNKMNRISKPGRRVYSEYSKLPRLFGGKGFYLISTSRGVLTNIEAKELKVGGEILLSVI